MTKYRIAYIDEDISETREFQRYAKAEFEVLPISPQASIDDLVTQIINEKVEAVIIDFDLTDKDPNIHYKGNQVAEKILEIREGFPVFIFTSFDEQAIEQSDDVNIIYQKSVMGEKDFDEKVKFKERVKKQIEHYKKKIETKGKRLIELLKLQSERVLNIQEDEELIELDDFLEKSLSSKNSIPKNLKKNESTELLSKLINNTEEILKAVKEQK